MNTKSSVTKKKGTKVATSDRVATALGHIQAAIAAMALSTPKLTTRQKKLAAKARKGSEKVIPTITALANQLGVNLPTQPTSLMTAHVALANELEPLRNTLQAFLATVEGTAFQANSNSWETATTLYGILKKVAKSDPEIRTQLAPVQDFFAYRHPLVQAKHPKGKKGKAALALLKSEQEKAAEPAVGTGTPSESAAGGSASAASHGGAAPNGASHTP